MEIKVRKSYMHMSPRKIRPVLYGFRGMTAEQALNNALFTNKKAARFLVELIKSGIAAAKENYLDADKITIKSIYCNEGPRLKRIQPWSKGQARRITKRMSHLGLILESFDEKEAAKETIKEEKE